MSWCESIILGVALMGVLLIVGYSLRTGISPMPSSSKVVSAMLSLIPAQQTGWIVDLGAGWGSLLIPVAKHCSQARVSGYELSPLPWLVARLRVFWFRDSRITVYRQDFFEAPLEQATVVLCYLYTGAMKRLSQTLIHQLRPGTLVISHTFVLPGWQPIQTQHVNDLYRTPIYVYRVPDRVPSS